MDKMTGVFLKPLCTYNFNGWINVVIFGRSTMRPSSENDSHSGGTDLREVSALGMVRDTSNANGIDT